MSIQQKIREAIAEKMKNNINPKFIIMSSADRAELWKTLSDINSPYFPGERNMVYGLMMIDKEEDIIKL